MTPVYEVLQFHTPDLGFVTVNVTVFVSGTLDLFNAMCKQHHRTASNPFINGTKNGDFHGTCKLVFTCYEQHRLFVRVDLHLSRDPFAVEVREPPALLLVLVIAVLVRGTNEGDPEEPLRRLALRLAALPGLSV